MDFLFLFSSGLWFFYLYFYLGLQSFWITSFYGSNLKTKQQQQHQFINKEEAKKCNQWFQSDKFALEHNLQHNCNEHREVTDQGYIEEYYPQLLQQQKQQQQENPTYIYEKPDYRVFDLQPLTFSNGLQRDSNKLNFSQCATKRIDCSAATILETEFSATDTTMDDVLCQNHYQNSIYVLNSNYSTYVNYPQFNHIDRIDEEKFNKDGKNYGMKMTTAAAPKSTSSVPRIFHCKLKTLAQNAGNPNVSSTSSAICLPPAAAAIQKILNCTTKLSPTNANNNNSSNNKGLTNNKECPNNNNNYIEERDCCLSSITATDIPGIVDAATFHYNGNNKNNNNSSRNNFNNSHSTHKESKKKSTNVKAHLIAKKTKFWQYLEEEKLRSLSENYANGNGEKKKKQQQQQQQPKQHEITNSSVMKSTLQQTTPSNIGSSSCSFCETKTNIETKSTCGNSMSPVRVFEKNKKHNNLSMISVTTLTNERNDKSNNSTGNCDKISQQQQQYFEILKNLNKSNNINYDFYSETADLLGLGCTFCDNCRCLDCQSGYFDCDDWESNSDLSLMDEYDEPFVFDPSMRFYMQPCNYYYDEDGTTTNGNNESINCNDVAGTSCSPNETSFECTAIEHETFAAIGKWNNHNADDATILMEDYRRNTNDSRTRRNSCNNLLLPLEETTQNNELENCASFNELSLLDDNTKESRKSKQQEIALQ